MSTIEQVAEFHRMTDTPIESVPFIPTEERCKLRVDLLAGELLELRTAISDGDIVAIGDALTDLQYVLDGAYLEFGMMDIKTQLFDEVHRSNMTKGHKTMIDAVATAEHLANGNNPEYGCINCSIEPNKSGEYFIVKAPNAKVMKPLGYSKARLDPIVFSDIAGKILTNKA